MTIRVIIADDHPVVRSGVRSELTKYADFDVIKETMNTDDALSLTLEYSPDVLILDINMPGSIKAIDLVRKIKQDEHPTKILIITAHNEAGVVIGSIQAGADGFLLKDDDITCIPEAVRAIAKGNDWVSQSVTKVLTTKLKNASKTPLITNRESEVLLLVSEGMKNDDVARELGISRRTVEFHMTNIMEKLDLESRGKVIAWAKKNLHLIDSQRHVI